MWLFQDKTANWRGHRNDTEVIFAKPCGKHYVSGSVYAKKKGKTKGNKTQFFQYVKDDYEEDDNQLFFMPATGRTRSFLQMGQPLYKSRRLKHTQNSNYN